MIDKFFHHRPSDGWPSGNEQDQYDSYECKFCGETIEARLYGMNVTDTYVGLKGRLSEHLVFHIAENLLGTPIRLSND